MHGHAVFVTVVNAQLREEVELDRASPPRRWPLYPQVLIAWRCMRATIDHLLRQANEHDRRGGLPLAQRFDPREVEIDHRGQPLFEYRLGQSALEIGVAYRVAPLLLEYEIAKKWS